MLIVHDEEDNVAPIAQGAALAAAIPDAVFVRTRGLGHSGGLRDADTIRRVVEFLIKGLKDAKQHLRWGCIGALSNMKTAAKATSLSFWQWAWYWQYLPAISGAPAGFGVGGRY